MAQQSLLSAFSAAYAGGASAELLEALPQCKLPRALSADNAGLTPARVLIGADLGGQTLPQDAAGLILMLLLWQNRRENGKNKLEELLLEVLREKRLPALHYQCGDELAVSAELCVFLGKLRPLEQAETGLILSRRIVSTGLALYVYLEAEKYIKTADIAAAMTLEAVRGELGAFDARLHEIARPFPGQIAAAENVRRLVAGSGMTTDEGRYAFGYDKHPRVQDAISLRAMPQTHGGVRDVHAWLGENLEQTLTDGMAGDSFLLEYGLDWLLIALADLGNISEERTFRLTEDKFSYGLPTNLVFHQGYNHGYPVVQACQAAMLAELKLKALPGAAVKSGVECAAYSCAVRAVQALPLLSKVLATEVLMAAQAMDIVQDKLRDFHFGKGTQAALGAVRRRVDVLVENRFVAPDMCAADELVANGEILAAAAAAVGQLN